jgi:hypothetical protein
MKKYFGTKPLDFNDSCQQCFEECATCKTYEKCDSCVSNNAIPNVTSGCYCKNKFFGIYPLNAVDSCKDCHEECAQCNEAFKCLECISSNAIPSETLGCGCIPTTFGTKPLKFLTSCQFCHPDCSDCIEQNKCTSCIASNSTPKSTFGCGCNDGFYSLSTLLPSNDSCLSCHIECRTCNTSNICLTCLANNASPKNDWGCQCHETFYSISALNSSDSCLACHSECLVCVESLKCLSCKSLYAKPSDVGCECFEFFYALGELIQIDSCRPCHEECASCSSDLKCLTCKSDNSIPSLTIGCECLEGYYSNTSLSEKDSCLKCRKDCKSCINEQNCTSCFSKYSEIDLETGICKCIKGFYSSGLVISQNSCKKCHSDCLTCDKTGTCLTCFMNDSKPAVEGCECFSGFYRNGSNCLKCHPVCSECSEYEFCLKCKNPEKKVNLENGKCEKICPVGTVNIQEVCRKCPGLCETCDKFFNCLKCDENSEIVGSVCECQKGFMIIGGTCKAQYFHAKLLVSQIDNLRLAFEEPTEVLLESKDFQLHITGNNTFSWTLLVKQNKTYTFFLDFQDKIKSGTNLSLRITRKVYSKSGLQLSSSLFQAPLKALETFSPSLKTLKVSSSLTSQILTTTSLGVSFFSDPSTTWSLLNTIQFFSYIPLNSNPFPSTISEFCKSLKENNIFPNAFLLIFNKNDTKSPFKQAQDYGFETSVFLINSGASLSLFGGILALWPALKLLRKTRNPKVSEVFLKVSEKYKFGVFFRFWIQVYLEFGIFAIIQLKSVKIKQPADSLGIGYFHTACAVVVVVSFK